MDIALFVHFGLGRRRVTFTDLVDLLAAAFSPHYLEFSRLVSTIRQLSLQSVHNCRRDLLLRGVLPNRIWNDILRWRPNPLFTLRKKELGHDTVITPQLRSRSLQLDRFRTLIANDPALARWPGRGLRLNILDNSRRSLASGEHASCARMQPQKICAERPYNVVRMNDAAVQLLRIQEAVVLSFDVAAFKEDHVGAAHIADRAAQKLMAEYDVRAEASNQPRLFRQEGKTFTSRPRASEVRYRSYSFALRAAKHEGRTRPEELSDEYLRAAYSKVRDAERLEDPNERKIYLEERKRYFRRIEDAAKKTGAQWDRLGVEVQEVIGNVPEAPEELWLLDRKSRDWRRKVQRLLTGYDAASYHLSMFSEVYEQVRSHTGLLPIHTRFRFLLNRRFYPECLWPTHVTSRRSWTSSGDESFEPERDA